MSEEAPAKGPTRSLTVVDAALPDNGGAISGAQRRKRDSREKMLTAAAECFLNSGYQAASVDDITKAAGVSRMTFYRHFSGKVDLLFAIFQREAAKATPKILHILREDFRDRATVRAWIRTFFERDRGQRHMLGVINQVVEEEPEFAAKAQHWIDQLILGLGETIPAFAVSPDDPAQRRQWLEAWLLLYEILDHSNHAARNSGISSDPLVIDILTERFLDFVAKGDTGSKK